MTPSLMDALTTALGKQMTVKLYEQWKAFWKFIFTQISEVNKGGNIKRWVGGRMRGGGKREIGGAKGAGVRAK